MNIPIPSIPTDNLYKFSTFFGILLILSSTYIYWQLILSNIQFGQKVGQKVDLYEINNRDNHAELEELASDSAELHKYVELMFQSKKASSKESITDVTQKLQLLQNRTTAMETLSRDNYLLGSEISNLRNELLVRSTAQRYLTLVLLLHHCTGYYLLIFGLTNWYTKIQKFEDRMIANKAKKLR